MLSNAKFCCRAIEPIGVKGEGGGKIKSDRKSGGNSKKMSNPDHPVFMSIRFAGITYHHWR